MPYLWRHAGDLLHGLAIGPEVVEAEGALLRAGVEDVPRGIHHNLDQGILFGKASQEVRHQPANNRTRNKVF